MSEGWVKIHRKMIENPVVMKDSEHLAVWIYLLLNATHKDIPVIFKGEKIELHPGQLLTGRKSISKALCVNESKIYRILNEFKIEQQIEQQTSNKNSLITIVNWELYQIDEQQFELQMNNKRTTSEQQVNTNKNDKECKELKNEKNNKKNNISIREIFFPNDELLDNAFREYVLMRKKIKKPFATDHAIDLAIKKLENLSDGDNDKAIEILNQSIEHSWIGLFELKEQKNKSNQNEWLDMWKNA